MNFKIPGSLMRGRAGAKARRWPGELVCFLALAAASPPLGAQQRREVTKANGTARPGQRADVARFQSKVTEILNAAGADTSYWGIYVEDRDTGEILYELNGDRYFVPASNAKIFATGFALAELGPDYRFRTTLESTANIANDGQLAGDLILVGRGDPDLSNRKFPYAGHIEREGSTDRVLAELADAVVAKGLRSVEGDIVADDSYFPYDPYPAGWSTGDLFFTFGAPVNAIDYNDNSFAIEVQPGGRVGEPAIVKIDPPEGADYFSRELVTVASSWQPDFSVVRQPGGNFTLVRGAMPLGHAPVTLSFAMTEPSEVVARTLKDLLEARGVHVSGSARVRHAPPPQRSANGVPRVVPGGPPTIKARASIELAGHESPPLIESVTLTNKISQNLHAEIFLRTVAREKTGIGSIDAGLQLENGFLQRAGIADGDVQLSDGSGLARDDLVRPRAMVQFLAYAAHQPWGAALESSFPVGGVDGTIEERMKQVKAAGLIEAKTGSFEHVHALSGYATTAAGEHLIFSIFANNDPERGRGATHPVDAIADAMIAALGARPTK